MAGTLISAQPASAAVKCYTHSKVYTLSGGYRGQIVFVLCANGQYVKTFETKLTVLSTRAVWGDLVAADNHNHSYNTGGAGTMEPDTTYAKKWDVNMNWYNGWRACGVATVNGYYPSPAGHACIKLASGGFQND